CLFQREARVLSDLDHPGIPKVEPAGYFRWPPNSPNPSHCLVMEKIDGTNLKDWLSSRNNQPITQEQAIAWLKQLAEILQQVHQRNYFHRDIKPSNIMLKPDGQLVLIDFGAVREVTETYLRRLEGSAGTAIISPGYTPPEQADGRAVSTSDFYALGRTFVHLLTGIHPHDLQQDLQTEQLDWRKNTPEISQELADLIEQMMAPFSANRPRDSQEILQRLQEIDAVINKTYSSITENRIETPKRFHHLGNNRRLGEIVLSIILVLGGIGIYSQLVKQPKACDLKKGDFLSCGEEALLPGSIGDYKETAIQEFSAMNYDKAVSLFTKARDKNPKDPETLIYLNNARLGQQTAYTIAVAAPINKSPDIALEILRGVAQAQEEINQGKKIKGMGLRVVIADDANDGTQAKKLAEALVSKGDILAVIGHYASEVTLEAVPIYQQHKLVVISPGSTSEELTKWGTIPHHFFFRTVPTTKVAADYLVRHLNLNAQTQQKTAVVFNVPLSSFSRSLSSEFRKSFSIHVGKVLKNDFDLSSSGFDAEASIKQAQKQGATVLAVFPDGGTSTNGIPNTLRLIRANRGGNWIVGSNTLYSRDTLELLGEDALNRFVVVVTWHYLDSSRNPKFPQAARTLWGGNVSWRTATAYDATQALIAALEKRPSPSRESLRQILADKNFQAQGATGTISFEGGDRKEEFSTLVKVVRSHCSPNSYTFIPIDSKNLEQDCIK
ncbi:MAG TPA: bifunctional serine/threonine-protein kinase/ABC transporter substrate-binding protein, partial [Coleofasciculaceae cyanobacterium]